MKIINADVEIVNQEPGIEGVYGIIEKAGRLCYASDPIEGKAKDFYDRMVSLRHYGVVEHGTVYLTINCSKHGFVADRYYNNYHSEVVYKRDMDSFDKIAYVTTNMLVLLQHNWLEDLKFQTERSLHIPRYTVLFHTDRITGESFLRHRTLDGIPGELSTSPLIDPEAFSFCRQSTRYCNFSKKKFDGEVSFVIPREIYLADEKNSKFTIWSKSCRESEVNYNLAISEGMSPENARYMLSFSLYSPLMMSGTLTQWEKFFKLRCDKHAHPDAQFLAYKLMDLVYDDIAERLQ